MNTNGCGCFVLMIVVLCLLTIDSILNEKEKDTTNSIEKCQQQCTESRGMQNGY